MNIRLNIQAILPTVWISPVIDQTTTASQTAAQIDHWLTERDIRCWKDRMCRFHDNLIF